MQRKDNKKCLRLFLICIKYISDWCQRKKSVIPTFYIKGRIFYTILKIRFKKYDSNRIRNLQLKN